MSNNYKSIPNRIYSLFGLLFIGAIGSGLWDLIFKDLFYNIGRYFVEITSQFYSGYLDNIYENVGKMSSNLEVLPATFFIIFVIFSPIILSLYTWRKFRGIDVIDNNEKNKPDNYFHKFFTKYLNSRKKIIIFFLILTLPMSLLYSDLLIKESSNRSAFKYVDRVIEIIRPNIENSEYIKLRSELRQINNRQKLNDIIDKIHIIGLRSNIELPVCKLYGIKIIKIK